MAMQAAAQKKWHLARTQRHGMWQLAAAGRACMHTTYGSQQARRYRLWQRPCLPALGALNNSTLLELPVVAVAASDFHCRNGGMPAFMGGCQ